MCHAAQIRCRASRQSVSAISCQDISSLGTAVLSEVLLSNKTIRHLNLARNPLKDEGDLELIYSNFSSFVLLLTFAALNVINVIAFVKSVFCSRVVMSL
jgi:hypothetical protein